MAAAPNFATPIAGFAPSPLPAWQAVEFWPDAPLKCDKIVGSGRKHTDLRGLYMYSRWLALLTAAGIALAPAPASASVRYDPDAKTGTVTGAQMRKAFGWSTATLAKRAGTVVFNHDFWTDDSYTVTCGKRQFRVVHHRDFGRFELTDRIAKDGYGTVTFHITGPHAGISGTSVPPEPGQQCPSDQNAEIDRVRLISTARGWSLTATAGETHRTLITQGHQPTP
jgi:hypothetical protein